jgi:peptide deformylase
MKLVDSNDPVLRQECEKFNFLAPQVDLAEFTKDLVETMHENNGIGLSAIQVGVPLQIFTMYTETPTVFINPKILEVSEETIELEEGCLSFPGDLVKVKRPVWIIARFIQGNGKGHTQRFEGMSARVFQHEYDHMIGKNMFDHLSKLKREMYNKKKMKKAKNG